MNEGKSLEAQIKKLNGEIGAAYGTPKADELVKQRAALQQQLKSQNKRKREERKNEKLREAQAAKEKEEAEARAKKEAEELAKKKTEARARKQRNAERKTVVFACSEGCTTMAQVMRYRGMDDTQILSELRKMRWPILPAQLDDFLTQCLSQCLPLKRARTEKE
jgi:HSP90 family molecular chaperone